MNRTEKTYGVFDNKVNQKHLVKLENEGKTLFKVPVVVKKGGEITSSKRLILDRLEKFDWVIFSDVFAAEFFIEILEAIDADLFELDNLRVCSYGESVADRLRFVQIHSDVIANRITDDSILREMTDYVLDPEEFANLEILFVQADEKEFPIKEKLANLRSNITELKVYENQFSSEIAKIRLLTSNGAIDEFIFYSPDEVFDLAAMF